MLHFIFTIVLRKKMIGKTKDVLLNRINHEYMYWDAELVFKF